MIFAISSFFGSTIAISYLRDEITPSEVIIETISWYFPSSEAVNIFVMIGRVIATMIPEIIVLAEIFKTLLKKSFCILLK